LGNTPLTYARIQKDVEEVLRHLGITNACLIGHSDGGITGLRLAATGNIVIDKLVTIGSHWHLADDDPARALFAEVTAESWRDMFPESYDAYQRLNPKPDFNTLTDQILKLWLDTGPEGYPGDMIRNITGNLLVVRGDDDMLISRQQAVEIADMVSGACLLNVPFASHVIHEEKPEMLMHCINEFLNK
ncbi:MAG: alpha/beta fold hydrolase, partial [Halodesulfovibrio sp.]